MVGEMPFEPASHAMHLSYRRGDKISRSGSDRILFSKVSVASSGGEYFQVSFTDGTVTLRARGRSLGGVYFASNWRPKPPKLSRSDSRLMVLVTTDCGVL